MLCCKIIASCPVANLELSIRWVVTGSAPYYWFHLPLEAHNTAQLVLSDYFFTVFLFLMKLMLRFVVLFDEIWTTYILLLSLYTTFWWGCPFLHFQISGLYFDFCQTNLRNQACFLWFQIRNLWLLCAARNYKSGDSTTQAIGKVFKNFEETGSLVQSRHSCVHYLYCEQKER